MAPYCFAGKGECVYYDLVVLLHVGPYAVAHRI